MDEGRERVHRQGVSSMVKTTEPPATKLLINETPLQFLPTLAVLIGDRPALALQQVHYWLNNVNEHGRRTAHLREGRYWIYNSYDDWHADKFKMWSLPTIKRVFLFLEREGIVETRQYELSEGNGRKWYTINYERVTEIEHCGGLTQKQKRRTRATRQPGQDADEELSFDAIGGGGINLIPPPPMDQIDPTFGSERSVLLGTERTTQDRIPHASHGEASENGGATALALIPLRGEAAAATTAAHAQRLVVETDTVGELIAAAMQAGVPVTEDLINDAERVARELARGALGGRRRPEDCPAWFIRGCFGVLRNKVRTFRDEDVQGAAAKRLWADFWTIEQVAWCLDLLLRDPYRKDCRESLLTVEREIGTRYAKAYRATDGTTPHTTQPDGKDTPGYESSSTFGTAAGAGIEARAADNYGGFCQQPAAAAAAAAPAAVEDTGAVVGGRAHHLQLVEREDGRGAAS